MFRKGIIVTALVMLSGCVQLTPPTDESAQSWQDFGYQWAVKGYIIESQSDLVKKSPRVVHRTVCSVSIRLCHREGGVLQARSVCPWL